MSIQGYFWSHYSISSPGYSAFSMPLLSANSLKERSVVKSLFLLIPLSFKLCAIPKFSYQNHLWFPSSYHVWATVELVPCTWFSSIDLKDPLCLPFPSLTSASIIFQVFFLSNILTTTKKKNCPSDPTLVFFSTCHDSLGIDLHYQTLIYVLRDDKLIWPTHTLFPNFTLVYLTHTDSWIPAEQP